MAGSAQYMVVLDACVLYPFCIRDLLIRLAKAETYRARWTSTIQDEWQRNLLVNKPDMSAEKLAKTSLLMNLVVEDAEITDYEYLIPQLELPDEDDRHVLAAAIVGHADAIVTLNTKDFPMDVVSKHHIEILHPDDFLCNQLDLYRLQVLAQVKAARMALKNPPRTADELINSYRRSGLFQFSEALQEALPLI